jgi:hypothetical protein
LSDFSTAKASNYFNAACCFGLQNKGDSAIIFLKKPIENGSSDKANLLKDSDLTSVREHPKWNRTLNSIQEPKSGTNSAPKEAKFVTTDSYNFGKLTTKLKRTLPTTNPSLRKTTLIKPVLG